MRGKSWGTLFSPPLPLPLKILPKGGGGREKSTSFLLWLVTAPPPPPLLLLLSQPDPLSRNEEGEDGFSFKNLLGLL